MPELVTVSFPQRILACAAVLGALTLSSAALAQAYPPGPPPGAASNPMCQRLEAQLGALDRGGTGDPAKDDQIRRYQDAASRQQADLDRVTQQARRMGCESGFFSLFNGRSAECGPINTQMQQMRGNLDQITISLERLRGGGYGNRENQRHSVLLALAQNNCGPQYANAVRGPGDFLSNLFGGGNNNPMGEPGAADMGPPSGTYRTVCVRSCDGGYFPISFQTVPARFADDERTCKALCPAAEATLYAYRNPGEDMNAAVTVSGERYTALPNAFKFRTEYNPACSCKAAGQTWADALKSIDDKAAATQQGDIIVTEESAKRMQRPKGAPANTKKGAAPPATAANPSAPAAEPPQSTATVGDNKPIRTVGPTFIPPKQ